MEVPVVELGAVGIVLVGLNIWATRVVRRQTELPPQERRFQILFIWLLPVIGALITVEVHRRTAFHRPRPRLVADEIQHDIGGHGHSDGPH